MLFEIYLPLCGTGMELFLILTFLCCAAILPVNIVVGTSISHEDCNGG